MNRFLNIVVGWYVVSLSLFAACFATIFLGLAPQLDDALWTLVCALIVGELGVRLSLVYTAKHQRWYLILAIAAGIVAIAVAASAIYEAAVVLL
jgi:hypothetical protein